MYTVTLILPTDTTLLEERFAKIMADIVAEKLTHEELEVFIEKVGKLEKAEL